MLVLDPPAAATPSYPSNATTTPGGPGRGPNGKGASPATVANAREGSFDALLARCAADDRGSAVGPHDARDEAATAGGEPDADLPGATTTDAAAATTMPAVTLAFLAPTGLRADGVALAGQVAMASAPTAADAATPDACALIAEAPAAAASTAGSAGPEGTAARTGTAPAAAAATAAAATAALATTALTTTLGTASAASPAAATDVADPSTAAWPTCRRWR